jgi:uncharacterized protein (UPF0297 family)
VNWTISVQYGILLSELIGEGSPLDKELISKLEHIAASIKEAGFDPFEQMTGYIRTGDARYITRTGNARELIKGLDRRVLKEYAAYLKSKK